MRRYSLAAAALLLTTAAYADFPAKRIAFPGFYIGGNVGYATGRVNETDTAEEACNGDPACTVINSTIDENAFGLKLFGGYLFNDFFAIEGGYFNLGELSFKHDTSTGETYKGTAKTQGLNADVVGHLPILSQLTAFARLGVMYAEVSKDYSYSGGTLYVNGVAKDMSPSQWGAGLKVGLGVQYDFTPRLGVRGEWEGYHMEEDASNSGLDMSLWSVGVVYRFGEDPNAPVPPPEPEKVVVVKEVPVPAEPVVVEKVVEKEVVKEVPSEPVIIRKPVERVVLATDALFDFNKATVKPEGKAAIRDLVLKLQKDDKLIVTGHTDSIGSELYNLKLSQRRADAVKNELVINGIGADRIETKAKGESDPVATNATDEGRAQNRRVEIDIIAAPKEPGEEITPPADEVTLPAGETK
ncbi:OmpA family protein [Sulfurimonas sp. HSL1-6]|uniref:OmpA family protein n=1 Tax=Thiomicrolovo immobilis TaxID=3131935 RepID=UPI0031F73001